MCSYYKTTGECFILRDKLKSEGKLNVADTSAASTPPAILIRTVPAELIQTKGDPEFANVSGTELLYISNSEEDIFKNIPIRIIIFYFPADGTLLLKWMAHGRM